MAKSPKHGLTHGTRGWYKRINGKPAFVVSDKLCPTGKEADAFYTENFKHLWEDSKASAAPDYGAVTVADLFDAFLVVKRAKVAAGHMEDATLAQLSKILQSFVDVVGDRAVEGLTPADFGKASSAWSKLAPKSQRRQIIAARGAFKWGVKPPLNLPAPNYGDSFTPPGNRELRRHAAKLKAARGSMVFTADEIRVQLAGVTVLRSNGRKLPIRPNKAMRAMILLGINCGFGNADCASLPRNAVNLDTGWIEYARIKTGAERKAKLWPETVEAIRKYLLSRPKPKRRTDAGLMFLTHTGQPYLQLIRHRENHVERRDEIAELYRRMLKRMGQWRSGRSFYSLRRTCRTIGGEVGEELALDLLMGHLGDASEMRRIYTLAILESKLVKVSEHIRSRIFTVALPVAQS